MLRDCAFAFATALVAGSAWAQDVTGTISKTSANCAGNSNALGVSRIVEIDTAGGPGFGSEQFKAYDFLQPGEVVLTFDDGPWPGNTPAVLKALAEQCTKATFFPIGKHALWHPELLKEVAAAGDTIGSHTFSHADLARLPAEQAEEEIEKGVSAVRAALGQPEAPFFRFPGLRYTPELVSYLGTRNISAFSADFDSQDFRLHKPEQVNASVMTRLQRSGQRHHPHARLPACDVARSAGAARSTQSEQLQDRAGASQNAGCDVRPIRRAGRQRARWGFGGCAAVSERGAHDR
jgi:peptidoglycan/xylan/chitin deacetylase (PgdA/CDA1 family)